MMNVEQIQTAILQLPEIELTRFRNWYEEWEASLWDKQIEQDQPWQIRYSQIPVYLYLTGPTDTIAKGSDSICRC